MAPVRFAALLRAIGDVASRRSLITSPLLAWLLMSLADAKSSARKKGRKKKRRKKKDKNRCRRAGEACNADADCCPDRQNLSCQNGTCRQCDVCLSGCEFSSVQAAMDAIPFRGGTVHICPGAYRENITIQGDVSLIGVGSGANGTILDGQGNGPVVTVANSGGNASTAVLRRLRITGGDAEEGGGLFIAESAVTLSQCVIEGNRALERGAGIFCTGGVVTLDQTTVTDNSTREEGVNRDGGGIDITDGTLTLIDSAVTNNLAHGRGGGIRNISGSVVLIRSRVEDNRLVGGGEGGGLFNFGGTVSLMESAIASNQPTNCGGTEIPGCSG